MSARKTTQRLLREARELSLQTTLEEESLAPLRGKKIKGKLCGLAVWSRPFSFFFFFNQPFQSVWSYQWSPTTHPRRRHLLQQRRARNLFRCSDAAKPHKSNQTGSIRLTFKIKCHSCSKYYSIQSNSNRKRKIGFF